MAKRNGPAASLNQFGTGAGLVLGILCGATTLATYLAKPDGWQYAVAVLVIVSVAFLAWATFATRTTKRAEKADAEERARDPEMVRCGGEDAGNPFFCGKMVPEWFARDMSGAIADAEDDDGPPRCFRCLTAGEMRYPGKRETEAEYREHMAAREREHAAAIQEYESLAADFARPADGQSGARVDVGKLRVDTQGESAAETARTAEEEAAPDVPLDRKATRE